MCFLPMNHTKWALPLTGEGAPDKGSGQADLLLVCNDFGPSVSYIKSCDNGDFSLDDLGVRAVPASETGCVQL